MQGSIQPGAHGGNLDNKRLGPGATLYLPVNVKGAHFSAGDGHAVQGDGEFCDTALETCMHGEAVQVAPMTANVESAWN